MGDAGGSRAEVAFMMGWAIATGAVSAAPDDPFEAARGAFINAVLADDPEWSPRASYVLGDLCLQRGDLDGAASSLRVALESGHQDWKPAALVVNGVICAPGSLTSVLDELTKLVREHDTGSC